MAYTSSKSAIGGSGSKLHRDFPNVFQYTTDYQTGEEIPAVRWLYSTGTTNLAGDTWYGDDWYAWTLHNFVERFWTIDGQIAYCFDYATSDEGSRSRQSLNSLPSYFPKDKLFEVYKWSSALTAENFKLIKENASTIAQAFSDSYYTIRKVDVVELLQSDKPTAIAFKRQLVQSAIWRELNNIVLMPTWEGLIVDAGGYDKEGNPINASNVFYDEALSPAAFINYPALIGVGKRNSDSSLQPGDAVVSTNPNNHGTPWGVGEGQIIIMMRDKGKLKIIKQSKN